MNRASFDLEFHRKMKGGNMKYLIHLFAVHLLAIFVAAGFAVADDGKLPLSAPVKVLSSADSDDRPAEMPNPATPAPQRPQPTTPGGKLPQYQLDHHHRTLPSEAELKDARLRLILALPAKPVLIEVTITIDGQPFRMAREKRIRQIIEQATRPAATTPATPNANVPQADSPQEGKTPDADAEKSDKQDDEEKDDAEETPEEPEAKPVAKPTVAPYSMAATVPERIRRYIEATGEAPSADEVRWLLTNWVDGPTLLMLNDNFQRFRANQRPVFRILDRNRDETISAEELKLAVKSFNECDLNRNDIISYTELAKVAADPRLKKSQHAGPGKLMFQIPDEKSATATYRRIASRYRTAKKDSVSTLPRFDKNLNGRFDADELKSLREAEPDLSFAITFDSANPAKSRISVTAVKSEMATAVAEGRVEASGVTLPLGGTTVSFSAIQAGPSDQISIGAVNDGYPILPVIDPNEDGRFTIRELRGLVNSLRKFDRNRDGSLTLDETPATIRICFGLGPHVHRELAELRRVNPKSNVPTVTGPEWFVRMDRNKDNDLSRGEFPGTDEQYKTLDADGDALISAAEANEINKNKDKKPGGSANKKPQPEPKTTTESSTEMESLK